MRDAGALDAAPKELVNDLLNRLKPRGKSLIVTVFGDALQPHGGGAWLGGLIRILGPMGLSERAQYSGWSAMNYSVRHKPAAAVSTP